MCTEYVHRRVYWKTKSPTYERNSDHNDHFGVLVLLLHVTLIKLVFKNITFYQVYHFPYAYLYENTFLIVNSLLNVLNALRLEC